MASRLCLVGDEVGQADRPLVLLQPVDLLQVRRAAPAGLFGELLAVRVARAFGVKALRTLARARQSQKCRSPAAYCSVRSSTDCSLFATAGGSIRPALAVAVSLPQHGSGSCRRRTVL